MTTDSKSFLQELDDAVLRGSAESREKALSYATDMLMIGRYSDEDIWMFGEVIGRLADAIEVAARAQLSRRLANASHAPINVVKKLAFDDAIEVAGPILQHCERLDSETLVANIRTKSQPHMLAISRRASIPAVVTDELVTRGNQEVVTSVAANGGASFSDFAFLHAIKRSKGDSILAEQLGLRQDIPRQMFQQLIAKASADVRRKLQQERPELAGQIQTSIADVAGSLQSRFDPATEGYANARKIVTTRHQLGELKEAGIREYARGHKIEETIVGLSLMSALPLGAVERALADPEMTLILAKALKFEWETTMALLFLGARDHRIKSSHLDSLKEEFARLTAKTSQDVLNFYQSRKRELAAQSGQQRLPQFHQA